MEPDAIADPSAAIFALTGAILDAADSLLLPGFVVFIRVAAITALLPGLGEQLIPVRLRLGVALAFTVLVAPLVSAVVPPLPEQPVALGQLILAETAIGLAFGLSVRLLVMAMQIAGSIAAQSTSIAQIAGVGVTPDPTPAVGNVLVLGALTLALVTGLPAKAVLSIAQTYTLFPPGAVPEAAALAAWGTEHGARAFGLAFSLAAPFVIAALAYNVALGAINRAMPQLMVAFVGAPAITGVTIALLLLVSPVALAVWLSALDGVLADPFGPAR